MPVQCVHTHTLANTDSTHRNFQTQTDKHTDTYIHIYKYTLRHTQNTYIHRSFQTQTCTHTQVHTHKYTHTHPPAPTHTTSSVYRKSPRTAHHQLCWGRPRESWERSAGWVGSLACSVATWQRVRGLTGPVAVGCSLGVPVGASGSAPLASFWASLGTGSERGQLSRAQKS